MSVASWLEPVLARAVDAQASDVHLMCGERPRMRVLGALHHMATSVVLTGDDLADALRAIAPPEISAAPDLREADFSHTDAAGRRYRVSAFQERRGLALAFRVLAGRPPTLDALDLPRDLLRCVHAPGGLVLFAGQAGAGKTTTLAAVLQSLVDRRAARVVTVEDPIEYRLAPGAAWVEQREVGRHCQGFAGGIADALEAAPDALAIGELRDLDTIRLALQAAETGVLVLSTVHAQDVARAVGRIVDAFDPEERAGVRNALAGSLRMVVAQMLLPRADGRGRAPAIEVAFGGTALATLVREGKEHELQTLLETSRGRGMRTLDDSIADLIRRGVVTPDEGLRAAVHPEHVRRRVR